MSLSSCLMCCLAYMSYSASHKSASQAVGMTSKTCSSWQLHSSLVGVSGIVPGKIMEQPGIMRPAALSKALLQHYLQICWLLSYQIFSKKLPAGMTPRGHSSIDGFRDGTVERWNSSSQIMEWLGTMRPAFLWIYSTVRFRAAGSWGFQLAFRSGQAFKI